MADPDTHQVQLLHSPRRGRAGRSGGGARNRLAANRRWHPGRPGRRPGPVTSRIQAARARVILPVRSRHPPAETVEAHMTSRPLIAAAAALLLTTLDAPSPLLSRSRLQPRRPASPSWARSAFVVDTAQMDRSVKPGDDFYKVRQRHVAGDVQDPGRQGELRRLRSAQRQGRGRRAHAARGSRQVAPGPGLVGQKVIDLYESWMDEAAIEARGVTPLKADFDAIAAAKSKADITRLMGRIDYTAPFGSYIIPDPADPTRYVVGISQSGLMPKRDYYLNTGDKFDAYRAAYKTYVTRILALIGDKTPADCAGDHRARDEDRRGPLAARDAARHPGDQQPDRSRGPGEAHPRGRLEHRARGWRSRQRAALPRQRGLGDQRRRRAARHPAPRDVEDLPGFHSSTTGGATDLPRAFDEANFDFDSEDPARRGKAARSVEARYRRGSTATSARAWASST